MHQRTVEGAGGIPIALAQSAPDRCDAFFVHANGFCKETLYATIEELAALVPDVSACAIDQRGHGSSGSGTFPYRWQHIGDDVRAVLSLTDARPLGIGHSSGGAGVTIAQLDDPSTFAGLVLIEPMIAPPPYGRRDGPMSYLADRRRRSFPSRAAVFERFGKGPFATWDTRALDAYLDHAFGLVDGELVLRCDPEVEADIYREGFNHDTWDRLTDLDVPIVVVVGETSTTHHGEYLEQLVARLPGAELIVVSGAGHLVPMEAPRATAQAIVRGMEAVGMAAR